MELPPLGLGTWHMGEDPARHAAEVSALRAGLDLGVGLVDTAEMYGDGGAEEVVGDALRGRASRPLVVSKFYPHHAGRRELPRACEASLARLGVEAIDLYLYHWRGRVPLAETVDALEALVAAGRIRHWGVSNFDVGDLDELVRVPSGERVAANQVLYNLARRGVEFELLDWCRARDIAVMAYSPLDEGPLGRHPALRKVGERHGASAAQVAIAWILRQPGVCAIPKASDPRHVQANAASRELALDPEDLAALDRAFPPPRARHPLEVI